MKHKILPVICMSVLSLSSCGEWTDELEGKELVHFNDTTISSLSDFKLQDSYIEVLNDYENPLDRTYKMGCRLDFLEWHTSDIWVEGEKQPCICLKIQVETYEKSDLTIALSELKINDILILHEYDGFADGLFNAVEEDGLRDFKTYYINEESAETIDFAFLQKDCMDALNMTEWDESMINEIEFNVNLKVGDTKFKAIPYSADVSAG